MKNKRLLTHGWFKVVTQSRIIVLQENLTSSTAFGAINLLKKN
jgi:hypothetical protein